MATEKGDRGEQLQNAVEVRRLSKTPAICIFSHCSKVVLCAGGVPVPIFKTLVLSLDMLLTAPFTAARRLD